MHDGRYDALNQDRAQREASEEKVEPNREGTMFERLPMNRVARRHMERQAKKRRSK